jgi:hypothetical protein
MKKNLILFVLCISFAYSNAQNFNPYALFGYEGKVLKTQEEETGKQSLFLNTSDTTQRLKTLVFNTKTQLVEYIDHNNEIYKTDSLLPTFVLRFISSDPHAKSYPGLSPYNFVGNMPIRAVDPDGRDIYILFYVNGEKKNEDNEMFYASALTRKVDIEKSSFFNPAKDKVVVLGVQDMASIQKKVKNIVDTYSPEYGKTQEFSIWSHGGTDGPIGSAPTSSDAVDGKQMSLTGWGKINFNWNNEGIGSSANFYGCNTGADGTAFNMVDDGRGGVSLEYYSTPSFANQISSLANFNNVSVAGQTTSSFPSMYTNYRQNSENGPGNFINSITQLEGGGTLVNFQKTYMVGGVRMRYDLLGQNQNVANPMQTNVNGQTTGTSFQQGTTKP